MYNFYESDFLKYVIVDCLFVSSLYLIKKYVSFKDVYFIAQWYICVGNSRSTFTNVFIGSPFKTNRITTDRSSNIRSFMVRDITF